MRPLRLSAIVLTAIAAAACGQPAGKAGGSAASGGGKVLNLFTARHYDSDQQIYDAFRAKTGIRVRVLEMAAPELIERLKAEGRSSPADVVMIADAGSLWRAEEAGTFQAIQAPDLDARIPAHLRDPKGRWWAFSRRARVIAYDKAKVRPEEVAAYEALATPRFKGQVCVRSSDNPYNLSMMASFIPRWGHDKALAWAKGVVANFARQPTGGDIDQVRAVGAGACQVALTNTYYYLRLAASKNPGDQAVAAKVALAFPEQAGVGTHINVSGAGVAANAPHRAEAIEFLHFLGSDAAQRIFAEGNNEYPAAEGAPMPPLVARYATFKADPIDLSALGQHQAEAQAIYNQAGWR
jgi:iron(III) transport system substrate-binding protein